MSCNKKILLSLLVGYGLFSTQVLAEEYMSSISEESSVALIKLVKEKENSISNRELLFFKGELSEADKTLINVLIESKLYDSSNAEIFVRSLEETEINELSNLLNDNALTRARQAVAATVE